MDEYRERSSGNIKTKGELIKENSNMSFPKSWGTSVYEALSVDPVYPTNAPSPSGEFKVVIRNGVEQDSESRWVWAWQESDMFQEYSYNRYLDAEGNEVSSEEDEGYSSTETITVTVQEQKDAKTAADTAALAARERSTRNSLLVETDHYALSDVTMSDAMKTYRQALRDVPQQTDFPSTISWPTKP